jgi:hypothetical protein
VILYLKKKNNLNFILVSIKNSIPVPYVLKVIITESKISRKERLYNENTKFSLIQYFLFNESHDSLGKLLKIAGSSSLLAKNDTVE